MPSKFWVSHSKLSLYDGCPKAYYFAYVFRNLKSGKKVRHITPSLALGQTVHTVLEELSREPKNIRFREPLIAKFENNWQKITGIKGGFDDAEQEHTYKKRGEEMMGRVYANRRVLEGLAVKIKAENNLPRFDLVPEDGIILCGKIDWLSFDETLKSVHIIDFKTGKYEERETSLQLPIYFLLAKNCQQYPD
jgi:ATP-dependent helicase/DNAse subunit B